MTANAFSDGLASIVQWQNQYLENMKSLFPGATPPRASNPWSAMFDGFSSGTNQQGVANNPFGDGLQNQIALMMKMTRNFTDNIESALTAAQQSGEQWQSTISKSLDEMQANFSSPQAPGFSSMNFSGPWNESWMAWQQLFNPSSAHTSVNPWPVNPWAEMNPMSSSSGFPNLTGKWPTMPGLGPDREKFEKFQRLQSLGHDYMTASFEFNEQYRNFWPHIIERLKSRIQDTTQSSDGPAPSARTLYNLWIDAAEEEYATITGQDSYQQAYGRMINAMMALRQASTVLQDDLLKAMNIPSMRELDTLSERLQRTRRENRGLRAELQALRDEISAINQAVSSRQDSSTTPRQKTSARKKTTRTKAAATKSV